MPDSAKKAPSSFARTLLRGSLWVYVAKYSGQGLSFLSTVILARLLTQEDFGLAGYALLVIGLLEVVRHLGIGTALVYLDDAPVRRDTAFWLGFAIAVLLAAATWLGAPMAAAFFQDPRATDVTRVLALHFPLAAIGNVHSSLITKQLAFQRQVLPEIGKGVAKGGVAIALAFMGFGVWSLLIGYLAGTAVQSLLLWSVIHWRPRLRFSIAEVRHMLGYGTSYALVEGLGYALQNLDYVVIGRFLGASALGVYTVAFRVPEMLIKRSAGILGSVSFPAFSKLQANLPTLRSGYLKTSRFLATLLTPAAMGIVLIAYPMVELVFGAKWAEAAPVLQAISVYTLLRALVFTAGSVYKAMGRPGLLNIIGAVQLAVTIPSLWWAAAEVGSIVAVAWVQVGLAAIFGAVKWIVIANVLKIGFAKQARQILPAVTATSVMAGAVLLAAGLDTAWHPAAVVGWRIGIGIVSYALAFWLLWREDFDYGVAALRETFGRSSGADRSARRT